MENFPGNPNLEIRNPNPQADIRQSEAMNFPDRRNWTHRLALLALVALPALLYWNAVWMRFGLRDDYSTLRETHEEPGKIFAFCTSQGRPVYGLLLEHSFARLDGINALPWARLLGAVCIGFLCAAMALVLERRLRWPRGQAVLGAALLASVPSVQVIVDWGICWPHAVAALLAVAAFVLADRALAAATSVGRVAGVSLAATLLLCGMLTYQSNAMFYAVPMAAGWLAMSDRPWRERLRWLVAHGVLVGLVLAVAFLLTKALFAGGVFRASPRIMVEAAWLDKLGWFLREPLDNALALFVVEDARLRTAPWFNLTAIAVATVIILGGAVEWRRRGPVAALLWWGGACGLGMLAYVVSLVAAERWPTYRTLLPLTGVVVVYLVRSIGQLGLLWPRWGGRLALSLTGGLVAIGAFQATQSSADFLAEPQRAELARLEAAAARIDPVRQPRVFVLFPSRHDTQADVHYLDEFGSLSGDSDWCTKEMLLLLLHERYPQQPELVQRLRLAFGHWKPPPGTYDLLIDLRMRH